MQTRAPMRGVGEKRREELCNNRKKTSEWFVTEGRLRLWCSPMCQRWKLAASFRGQCCLEADKEGASSLVLTEPSTVS